MYLNHSSLKSDASPSSWSVRAMHKVSHLTCLIVSSFPHDLVLSEMENDSNNTVVFDRDCVFH